MLSELWSFVVVHVSINHNFFDMVTWGHDVAAKMLQATT